MHGGRGQDRPTGTGVPLIWLSVARQGRLHRRRRARGAGWADDTARSYPIGAVRKSPVNGTAARTWRLPRPAEPDDRPLEDVADGDELGNDTPSGAWKWSPEAPTDTVGIPASCISAASIQAFSPAAARGAPRTSRVAASSAAHSRS
jgi:hypothetical protein